jgi:hypothetical protein
LSNLLTDRSRQLRTRGSAVRIRPGAPYYCGTQSTSEGVFQIVHPHMPKPARRRFIVALCPRFRRPLSPGFSRRVFHLVHGLGFALAPAGMSKHVDRMNPTLRLKHKPDDAVEYHQALFPVLDSIGWNNKHRSFQFRKLHLVVSAQSVGLLLPGTRVHFEHRQARQVIRQFPEKHYLLLSSRSKAQPCRLMRISVRLGRISALNQFLSIPK